jgi:hypothetical protein
VTDAPPSEPAPAADPKSTPPSAPAPEWANDEYLTSGQRFVRWNLVSLVIGLVALGAGWADLQANPRAPKSPPAQTTAPGN